MGAKTACPEVDDAVGRVQKPRIGVPHINRLRQSRIGLGEALDRRHGLRAGDRRRGPWFAFARRRAGDLARQAESHPFFVRLPDFPCPFEPSSPTGEVAHGVDVLGGVPEREIFVGKFGRFVVVVPSPGSAFSRARADPSRKSSSFGSLIACVLCVA